LVFRVSQFSALRREAVGDAVYHQTYAEVRGAYFTRTARLGAARHCSFRSGYIALGERSSDDARRFGSGLLVAAKFARNIVIQRVLGTPPQIIAAAMKDEQERMRRIMHTIQPIGSRIRGIRNDARISRSLKRFALDRINADACAECARWRLRHFAGAEHTAKNIGGARFVGFDSVGHLLVGRQTGCSIKSCASCTVRAGCRRHIPPERRPQ
jgi:hypothetical protein